MEGAASGTLVGITASSSDPNGGATFSLTNDANGAFTINPSTGVVTVNNAAKTDYETATSLTITVQSSDGTAAVTQTFTIAILDAAPSAPVDSNTLENRVQENAATSATVGITAKSVDPNSASTVVKYSLLDNAGGHFKAVISGWRRRRGRGGHGHDHDHDHYLGAEPLAGTTRGAAAGCGDDDPVLPNKAVSLRLSSL